MLRIWHNCFNKSQKKDLKMVNLILKILNIIKKHQFIYVYDVKLIILRYFLAIFGNF